MNQLHNAQRLAVCLPVTLALPLKSSTIWNLFTLLLLLLASSNKLHAQVGCLAQVNVTLNENCARIIEPEMILTGDYDPTNDIEISIDGLSDTLSGCGLHSYTVTVRDTDGTLLLECWGDILAEDKTPPLLTCPAGTNEAVLLNDMQMLRGELLVDSPFFNPGVYSCYQEMDTPLEEGERTYSVNTFSITSTDIYTFIGAADYDGVIGLYQGEFFPDDPCQNLIAQADNTYNGSIDNFNPVVPDLNPSLRLSLALQPGRTYTLVWTSREAAMTGLYGVAVFADGEGRVASLSKIQVELSAELICLDIEEVALSTTYTYSIFADGSLVLDYDDPFRIPQEVRNLLNFTGFPEVTDNCGDMLVTVYDLVEEAGDCGNWTITRNFSIADRYNSPCEDPALISTCTQIITVRKPTLDDMVLPPFASIMECDEGFPTDGDRGGPEDNPAPEYTGYPYLSTGLNFYNLDESVCNLGASYSDEPRIVTCPGGYYFRREWNIIDWCSPNDNLVYQQYIYVGDFTGPDISFTIPDYDADGLADTVYQYSTAPNGCLANIVLPTPTVNDGNGCSGVAEVAVQVSDAEGNFVTNATPASLVTLPIGDFLLNYCAADSCANQRCALVPLQVRDRTAPTAVCNDGVVISLGGADSGTGDLGSATLRAEDLDEGSSDNCSPVSLAIRRDEVAEFTETINFACSDVGDTIKIHLLVTDTAGNSNTCWLQVIPEDKLRPACTPPQDITLGCVELPQALPNDLGIAYITHFGATSQLMSDLFGGPTGTDNCGVDTLVERNPDLAINECGWGTITRRFEAWQLLPGGDVNNNGAIDIGEVLRSNNSCEQVITISEIHQFVIDFPEDAAANCGDPNVPGIEMEALGCDVLAVNVSDPQIFAATGDECYKYALTYDVINWCLWDGEYEGFTLERQTEDDGEELATDRAVEGNERPVVRYNNLTGLVIDRLHNDRDGDSQLSDTSPDLPDYGRYIYTQFVKVYDTTAPEIDVAYYGGPTELCPDLAEGQFGDVTGNCSAPVTIRFRLTDACETFGQHGNLVLSVISVEVDEFAVDTDHDGTINFNEFVTDQNDLSLLIDNGNGNYTFTGSFPVIPSTLGNNVYHAVRVLVEDGCGNRRSETLLFEVLDCKAPAPICIDGLTVTLMPQVGGGCAMSIWANDFEGAAIYDCTGQGDVEEDGQFRVDRYAIYRASEVAANPNFIPDPIDDNLVLTDADDATTVVYVYAFDAEGNYDYCETYVLVQQHSDCTTVNGTISGLIATEEDAAIAGVEVSISGQLSQNEITDQNGSYQFSGLTTGTDISVVPYLNADPVNGVTTFDLVLISKHILGIDPLDSPYKLIAADANHSESVTTLDMIQIRKLILQINTDFPNNTSWRFVARDHTFPDLTNPWQAFFPEVANFNDFTEDVQADFVGIKIGDVNGNVQANLNHQQERQQRAQLELPLPEQSLEKGTTYLIPFILPDDASLEGLQLALGFAGVTLEKIHFGQATAQNFHTKDQLLFISWNSSAESDQASPLLFTLEITAQEYTLLSHALRVSDRHLPAEAYRGGGEFDLRLAFNKQETTGVSLEQNVPNPFREYSQIGFTLAQQEVVELTITNAQGQVTYATTQTYVAGHHVIDIDSKLLNNSTGVFHYTLATGGETVSKKMVVLP